MIEPDTKRIRLQSPKDAQPPQHTKQQIFNTALQNFAKIVSETERQGNHQRAESETRRKTRKSNMLKPTPIRPQPLHGDGIRAAFRYSAMKEPLGNVIFGRQNEGTEDMGQKYECHVFEYNNLRKLTFFPIINGDKESRRYACVRCYQVYCVTMVLRNRLESLPICKLDELGPDKDPMNFPHYCAHWSALTEAQKSYFKEYYWQYNPEDHEGRLIEQAYNIGLFVQKMCNYDTHIAKFCVDSGATEESALVTYIKSLDYTVKDERNAKSLLACFKTLHKNDITVDEEGRIHMEGNFDSQESGLGDSQSSQSSTSSQRSNSRRAIYAPPAATMSAIESMKNASSLVSDDMKSSANEKQKDRKVSNAASPYEQSRSALASNLAQMSGGTSGLQDAVGGLGGAAGSSAATPDGLPSLPPLLSNGNPPPDFDVKSFVSGLLMSTIVTVNNSQLQILYDGLRPLVARYAPNYLNQFVQMIHQVDRGMPADLHTVKLNTSNHRAVSSNPSINASNGPITPSTPSSNISPLAGSSSQLGSPSPVLPVTPSPTATTSKNQIITTIKPLPTIIRTYATANKTSGSPNNPITIDTDEALLKNALKTISTSSSSAFSRKP